MTYVQSLSFEEAANFDFMKGLIHTAANNAGLNIFDNIFDWTTLLVNKTNPAAKGLKRSNSSNLKLEAKLASEFLENRKKKNDFASNNEGKSLLERAKNFRFNDYDDVK